MSEQNTQNSRTDCRSDRRVFLCQATSQDESEILEATRRSESPHRPWAFPPRSHQEYESYLEKISSGSTIGFLVRRKSDKCLAGVINVSEPVMGCFRSAYLGFYAFAGSEARGYMTEGLWLVLDQAFEELKFHRLEANIQPGNLASGALVSRLGFRKEGFSPRYLLIDGEWRDHDRWAILSDEWRENRQRLFASRLADGRKSKYE